jgi:hypothetical protein
MNTGMIGVKPGQPPLWTSMNAVEHYEKAVRDTMSAIVNQTKDMIPPVFNAEESRRLKNIKTFIENMLPNWIKESPDIVVAGGVWATQLQNEEFKDVDIFVLGDTAYPHIMEQKHTTIRELMKSWCPSIEDKTDDYSRGNKNVKEVWTSKTLKFQIIFTKHATRKDLINDFDYVHCMASYTEGKLYLTRKIYSAIMSKKLIVQNNKNIQLWRKGKFYDRGYTEVFEEKKEPTLGDILAGALKTNPRRFTNIPTLAQEDYIPW